MIASICLSDGTLGVIVGFGIVIIALGILGEEIMSGYRYHITDGEDVELPGCTVQKISVLDEEGDRFDFGEEGSAGLEIFRDVRELPFGSAKAELHGPSRTEMISASTSALFNSINDFEKRNGYKPDPAFLYFRGCFTSFECIMEIWEEQ